MEWPTCPSPPGGPGMLPTVSAPAGRVGLHVRGVELLFHQVGEADADRGQGLSEVRLHDVAQEPNPKLLGGGAGVSWGVPRPREDISQLPHSAGLTNSPEPRPHPNCLCHDWLCGQPALCQGLPSGAHLIWPRASASTGCQVPYLLTSPQPHTHHVLCHQCPPSDPISRRGAHWAGNPAVSASCDGQFCVSTCLSEGSQLFSQTLI